MLWKITWGAGWWMDWKGRDTNWKIRSGGVLEGGETGLAEKLNVGVREEE